MSDRTPNPPRSSGHDLCDLMNWPLSGFLVKLAEGWRVAEGPNGEPAYVGLNHGRYSVMLRRDV